MKRTFVFIILLIKSCAVFAQQPAITVKSLDNYLSLTREQIIDSLEQNYICTGKYTEIEPTCYFYEAKNDKNQHLTIGFYKGKLATVLIYSADGTNFKNSILNADYSLQRNLTLGKGLNRLVYAKGGGITKHGTSIDIFTGNKGDKVADVYYHNWQNINNAIFTLTDFPDPEYAMQIKLEIKKYFVLEGSEKSIIDWYKGQYMYAAEASPTEPHTILFQQNKKYYKASMTALPSGSIALEFFNYNYHPKP